MDRENLQTWIGREEVRRELITAAPLCGLSATLDSEKSSYAIGDAAPELRHWLYFLPMYKQRELTVDGHPPRGEFMPPIALPRRMWAGSKLEFFRDLTVGSSVTRRSIISDVSLKQGKTGPLAFVKVRHEISDGGALLLVEEQDIVYRENPVAGKAGIVQQDIPSPTGAQWRRTIQPDATLLFRYSALTFNAHRIHYDRPYAQEQEGYGGLVVHGPLIATLLVDLVHRKLPGIRLREFTFKAVRPILDTAPFDVCGAVDEDGGIRLWACDKNGALATTAFARPE